MKYLFTLLATCFVLGLSAQVSNDSATKLINDKIESVKQDLLAQNNKLSLNEELKQEDRTRLSTTLTLSEDQIVDLRKALLENAKAIITLNNSDIAKLEKKERLGGLESQRDHLIFQGLNPQQQTAFKAAQMNR